MYRTRPLYYNFLMIKYLHNFEEDIASIEVPDKFTYPFYYTPTNLMLAAVSQVQKRLESIEFEHNFGIDKRKHLPVIGKMFGVLIVETISGDLGILTTHSGEIKDSKDYDLFVPSIVDHTTLENKKEESKKKVSNINLKISLIKENIEYKDLQKQEHELKDKHAKQLNTLKQLMKDAKKTRSLKRESSKLDDKELSELIKESLHYKHELKVLKDSIIETENTFSVKIEYFDKQIDDLILERKNILNEIQKFELEQYKFLNFKKESKTLIEIFEENAKHKPPAGTGNCSAPKLLQYAYQNGLKPIAISEFWWGTPHKSEIKKHKYFYPACTSRCKPILKHMLKGLVVEENELLLNNPSDYKIEIIYEDEYLLLINKPHGLLSVPGLTISDSVATRMKALYPKATGPLIVHRLDQETSGIMLIAKDIETYKSLQKQFIERTIKKKYKALLSEKVHNPEGIINLPLRGDINNRPYQMVCEKNGKQSTTKYKVLKSINNTTYIEFEPITGRTHQLRVHSAHFKGLNTPIVGDTLYGQKSDRLKLHASWIKFKHPKTLQYMEFNSNPDF